MPDEEAPPEEAPAQGEEKGGVSAGYGKYKVHIAQKQLPLVGMLFSGMVELIAISVIGRSAKYWAYGISLGAVAMSFAIIGLLLSLSKRLNDKVGMFNSYFLFLWCFIGALVMTFWGPPRFQVTSNGYFASWGMAMFSIMGVGVTANQVTESVSGMGSMLGLLASSVIVLIATIDTIHNLLPYRNEAIFALSLACVTLCVTCGFVLKDRNREGGGKDW
eukprot:CAMPEP_0113559956 /NCGR_PEP_ID=MMETSP0015_2-20120614/19175_1 /TAXON_ID=2838 /ORGANISM="Odontella" /LENGTH=217 /DNA_ID=CAMNT_0000461631 /DNA_START=153 /DNA_END=803 /DNA_ORIENTATION=- /assembly_acc=CAM_ASM_000160